MLLTYVNYFQILGSVAFLIAVILIYRQKIELSKYGKQSLIIGLIFVIATLYFIFQSELELGSGTQYLL